MTIMLVCAAVLILSVILSIMSRQGKITSLNDVLVANRGFGAFILFFVSVGEIYGIGTMLGAPGSVYAKGTNSMVWYLGYLLLAYSVGYFINPLIWRAGQKANLATIADFFSWRFNSKGLEVLVAILGMMFLLPWIQMQFAGLGIAIRYLGIPVDYTTAVIVAAIIAFLYIGIAGIRGSAWVAVMKDFMMIIIILIGGYIAWSHMPGGVTGIFTEVLSKFPKQLVVDPEPWTKNVSFTLSTILFQSIGMYMTPFTFQYVYTGASEDTVRHNQIFMPLYLFMYPFIIMAGFFALITITGVKSPDEVFLVLLTKYVPDWVMGIVTGGMALTCILVIAMAALPLGGLFTKNVISILKPNASNTELVNWNRIITAACLVVSVLLTIFFSQLMLGILNVAYYGFSQFFPAVISILFWKRATKWGVAAGLGSGIFCVLLFNFFNFAPYGLNKGIIALCINIFMLIAVSYMTPVDPEAEKRLTELHEIA